MFIKKSVSFLLAFVVNFCSTVYFKIVGEPRTAVLPPELVSDGTPKKYFTLSFDDGITQDRKIIELCKKYGFDGCTFNINTGLCGADWKWVGESFDRPDITHIHFTREELQNGVYDGFDVEAHTLNHPSLKKYDDDPLQLRREVEKDAENIYEYTGCKPMGMAWPGGDTEYTETTIDYVRRFTSIRFARATTPTGNYHLPERFLKWCPTCSISDSNVLELAEDFLNAECDSDMLFYVWGHGYELDLYDSYGTLEQLIKMMSQAEAVVCVTNAEFYLLFRDKIPS